MGIEQRRVTAFAGSDRNAIGHSQARNPGPAYATAHTAPQEQHFAATARALPCRTIGASDRQTPLGCRKALC